MALSPANDSGAAVTLAAISTRQYKKKTREIF
jgi:hypothetical protein